MAAYWIVFMDVSRPEPYEEYKKRTPAALQKYGGRFLARGGRTQALEGGNPAARVVLIEFPTFEQAIACYRSTEYQEARSFRQGVAHAQIMVVEGL
ncbi:MAG: DUF1330 domain-containing protein [Gammaproteobacteria bacterium]|nr:MAG: DUF1330 domain-containing protein [Gammaproteobacteria bacterium]